MDDSNPGRFSRRSFLGGSAGLALAGSMFGASMARSSAAADWDAIVIGARFAGVTAARDLQQAGARTLILEARSRTGGRTYSANVFGGTNLELGGAWVHWTQPNIWTEIQRYGLALDETPGASPDELVLVVDGCPRSFAFSEVAGDFVAAIDMYFRKCMICHGELDASSMHGVGRSPFGVVGREAASAAGYTYSQAMRDSALSSDKQTLDAFLAGPAALVPGTSMAFRGIGDTAARSALLCFIKSVSWPPG